MSNAAQKKWNTFIAEHKKSPFNVIAEGFHSIFEHSTVPSLWTPTTYPIQSNIADSLKRNNIDTYENFHEWSIKNKAVHKERLRWL